MAQQRICVQCGYVGKTKRVTKGSLLIEIVLWIAFIIPGILYSLWRLTTRYDACPSCGAATMIPVDSPKGREMLAQQGTHRT